MNGNIASSAGPEPVEDVARAGPSNIHHSRRDQQAAAATSSIARVRWSRRSWVSTRAGDGERDPGAHAGAVTRSARCVRNACLDVGRLLDVAAGLLLDLGRRAVGDDPPSRISSSRSQRSASSMTWLETSTAAPASAIRWNSAQRSLAQHRVEADGRLVEHQQLGLAEQRDGQAGAATAGRR